MEIYYDYKTRFVYFGTVFLFDYRYFSYIRLQFFNILYADIIIDCWEHDNMGIPFSILCFIAISRKR